MCASRAMRTPPRSAPGRRVSRGAAASAIIGAPWNAPSSSPATRPSPTAPCAPGPASPAATRARRPPRSSRPAARLDGIHAEWCINEKVALETAVGASLAGVRTLVTMKHVGLNVAADPFMTLSLTGVNAGLVVVSADDPGMHSSQNEQDNRNYAGSPRSPCSSRRTARRPTTSSPRPSRCRRSSTRRCCCARRRASRTAAGSVMPRVPVDVGAARVRARHQQVRHGAAVRAAAEPARARAPAAAARARRGVARSTCSRPAPSDFGIIASGVAYAYAREAFPKAWFLKLGMSHPLPYAQGRAALRARSRASPSSRSSTRSSRSRCARLGLPVIGKEAIPADGELDQEIVFRALEPFVLAHARRAAAARSCRRRRGSRTPPQPARRACRCARRCSARAARTARCSRRCAGTSWRRWATSAATRSARCRRCSPWTAASAWAPASA